MYDILWADSSWEISDIWHRIWNIYIGVHLKYKNMWLPLNSRNYVYDDVTTQYTLTNALHSILSHYILILSKYRINALSCLQKS